MSELISELGIGMSDRIGKWDGMSELGSGN